MAFTISFFIQHIGVVVVFALKEVSFYSGLFALARRWRGVMFRFCRPLFSSIFDLRFGGFLDRRSWK